MTTQPNNMSKITEFHHKLFDEIF